LKGSTQMELKLRQSFSECNENIGGELLLLDEHKMTTLEESQLVLEGVSGWIFYQSQNDGIEAIDEIFLFDVESAAFTNFNYLECAKQSCDDVCDLAVICFFISLPVRLKFKVDEFPQNVD